MPTPLRHGIGAPLWTPSLRWRLTLLTVAMAAVIQLLLGTVVVFYQRRGMEQGFNSRMENRAARILASLARSPEPAGDLELRRIVEDSLTPLTHDYEVIGLFDSGQTQAGTGPLPPWDLARGWIQDDPTPSRRRVPGVELPPESDDMWRVLIRRVEAPWASDAWLIVLNNDRDFEGRMSNLASLLAWVIPAALLGTGIASWVISGLAIAPLRKLSNMASSFAPETIRERVEVPQVNGELAKFQHDLVEVRERLRQSFHAQDRLIAHLSHELKTPIAVLMVEAGTLSRSELSPDAREFVQSVQGEMRRLAKVLESFMILSRGHAGRSLATGRTCSLPEVVLEAVRAATPLAETRRVNIDTRLPDDGETAAVRGEHDMLRLLVEHLLRGAIAASPRGDRVLVELRAHDSRCVIAVRDQGPAIPQDLLSGIFDWFTDATHECTQRYSPDLAIAKAITELHGGRIAAANTAERKGCVFTVELPAHRPAPLNGS